MRVRQRITSFAGRVGSFLLVAVVDIVLLPLAVVILPFVPVVRWWRERTFLRQFAGQSFLVMARRRDWREFLENNVQPVLPAQTRPVWLREAERGSAEWFLAWHLRRPAEVRHPFLVVASRNPRQVRVIPLHDLLLPLKPQARRSVETQRQVAEAIRDSFGDC